VTVVTATLKQLPGLAKPRRQFVAALMATILALRGRVNYRNLARYGDYCERSYARQFAQPFPWLAYHAQVLQTAVPATHKLIAAQDASFIPKSGKKTYGLGKFYNGCAGRAERGLEISALAVIDLTQKGAYAAAVAQTPTSAPRLKKDPADLTRLDHAITQLQAARSHLPAGLRSLAVDGWYAKQKYVDAAVALDLAVVTKLRNDANMRFRFSGPRTGRRGRPKLYDGKVNWQDLSRFDPVDTAGLDLAPGVEVLTAELYHCSLKRWLRVVVLVWHTADGKRHHAILATTDLDCTAADVLRFYQARFQLEFLFRDGKQFAGLTECQARNAAALDFHFNAALATVSAARAAAAQAQASDEPFVFSLASQKQSAFNEHFMAEISTKYGYDLSRWKNHPAYEELRSYGALAA
jgi:hypothetical protein